MKIQRALDLPTLLARKSCFLFGPRGMGKSFLIRAAEMEEKKREAL
jgi:predicted AAA+ superfamily ATPase